jgi:hypothetical protein
MRRSVVALIALGLAVSAAPAFAATESPMKACAAQWQAMKKAGTDKGTTYKDFSKSCMSKGASTTVASTTTTTTAPAPTPAKKPSILSTMMAKKTTTTTTAAAAPGPVAAPASTAVAAATTTKTKTTKTKTSASAKTAKALDTDPTGATANCKDGSYSHSKQHSGSCAGHGGVAKFLS